MGPAWLRAVIWSVQLTDVQLSGVDCIGDVKANIFVQITIQLWEDFRTKDYCQIINIFNFHSDFYTLMSLGVGEKEKKKH